MVMRFNVFPGLKAAHEVLMIGSVYRVRPVCELGNGPGSIVGSLGTVYE
jgi:hypothetical protein